MYDGVRFDPDGKPRSSCNSRLIERGNVQQAVSLSVCSYSAWSVSRLIGKGLTPYPSIYSTGCSDCNNRADNGFVAAHPRVPFTSTLRRNDLGYTSSRLARERRALPLLLLVKGDALIFLAFVPPGRRDDGFRKGPKTKGRFVPFRVNRSMSRINNFPSFQSRGVVTLDGSSGYSRELERFDPSGRSKETTSSYSLEHRAL